jgi:hypothetical protein
VSGKARTEIDEQTVMRYLLGARPKKKRTRRPEKHFFCDGSIFLIVCDFANHQGDSVDISPSLKKCVHGVFHPGKESEPSNPACSICTQVIATKGLTKREFRQMESLASLVRAEERDSLHAEAR